MVALRHFSFSHPAARHIDPGAPPPSRWWVDILFLVIFVALALGLIQFFMQIMRPADAVHGAPFEIDLAVTALPHYALLSLSRSFAAYTCSLAFALIYGGFAAKNRRAERVLIPVLDILQGIPVLGFMPGLVLGMVAIFPSSNLGLELACILMIFTGQVWNMAFSFYGSVRAIPTEMREVAQLSQLGWWKTFRTLEVPFSAIGLIWNSMMSMAGGWFFLTVNEAFRLGDRDFRLPGIGSYMSVAIERGDRRAMLAAVAMMTLMIVATDQLLWRPLAAWAQRFKVEDVAGDKPTSWVLDLLHGSYLARKMSGWNRDLRHQARLRRVLGREAEATRPSSVRRRARLRSWIGHASKWAFLAAGFVLLAGGGKKLGLLLLRVDALQWQEIGWALWQTFLRVAVTLLLGTVWALPAGIVIGRRPRVARIFQPFVQVAASFPAPMIYPIVTVGLLAAGVDFTYGSVVLMMLGAQWYILFNVIAGAQAIPADLEEAATMYGISGLKRWRIVYLPAVFPALLTGLVTAAGGAWNASIVSEIVTINGGRLVAPGLGSLITQATEAGDFSLLCAGVFAMSVALVVINRVLWKRLYGFADRRFSLSR